MNYVDSHTHFDLCIEEGNDTVESLLGGMKDSNVAFAVHVATETGGFQWAYDFARDNRRAGIRFALGIHPSSRADNNDLLYLTDFARNVLNSSDAPLLFGIGEAGLDYYRMRQPRDVQMRSFEYQADLARELRLPLIVHSRDAMDDTISLLTAKAPARGIMHCFSGNSDVARKVLDLGFYISFAGNITYKSATDIQDAARFVPLDRLLLETDAPFLTPVPFRGRQNRPGYVPHTYEYITELRRESPGKITDSVYGNFMALCPA